MRRSAIYFITLVAGAVSVALMLSTGASGAATPAYGVRSGTLVQHGRNLVWSVTLEHAFTGEGLERSGRSLCLLVGLPGHTFPRAQLCLKRPDAGGRPARLQLVPAPGSRRLHAHFVAAEVRRQGAQLHAIFRPQAIGGGYSPIEWQIRSELLPARCQATLSTTVSTTSALAQISSVSTLSTTTSTASPPTTATSSGAFGISTSLGATTSTSSMPAQCSSLYPVHPALARLHKPKLVGCRATGPSLVFNGPTNRRQIALTFDDGPWNDPPSMAFVNLLDRLQVPATFFEIGDQISTYDPHGTIERKMLAAGDMLGDHTWTHPDMTKLSVAQQRSQLQSTAAAIRNGSGFTPCLWRPPYGAMSPQLNALARSLGFLTIYWNIDPRDWSLPGVGAIEQNVLANARNGGIVELHYGGGPRGQTLAALPSIIDTLRGRGFHFVSIAQMLGLKMIYR